MTKVTINGKNLHKIQMRLKGMPDGTVCHLLYPEHRIKVKAGKNKIILHVPPLLAIELYHLFFKNKEGFTIKIKSKEMGLFQIKDISYPDELHDDGLVDITMIPL